MTSTEKQLAWIEAAISERFDFLRDFGYGDKVAKFHNMDATGRFVPDMPYVEVLWINEAIRKRVKITTYTNCVTFCEIVDDVSEGSVSVNDFLRRARGMDVGVHTMAAGVEDKLSMFLELLASEMKGRLLDVVIGEEWLDVPFDWQGQK